MTTGNPSFTPKTQQQENIESLGECNINNPRILEILSKIGNVTENNEENQKKIDRIRKEYAGPGKNGTVGFGLGSYETSSSFWGVREDGTIWLHNPYGDTKRLPGSNIPTISEDRAKEIVEKAKQFGMEIGG